MEALYRLPNSGDRFERGSKRRRPASRRVNGQHGTSDQRQGGSQGRAVHCRCIYERIEPLSVSPKMGPPCSGTLEPFKDDPSDWRPSLEQL